MTKKLRNQLIQMAEVAKEKGIIPLDGYLCDLPEDGLFFVSLGPRPPNVFCSDGKPFDLDKIFKIERET